MVASAVLGASAAFLVVDRPQQPEPPRQALGAVPPVPSPEATPLISEPEKKKDRARPRSRDDKRVKARPQPRKKHDRIVIRAPRTTRPTSIGSAGGSRTGSAGTASAPGKVRPAPDRKDKPKAKRPEKASKPERPEMQWPTRTLYHLYRKRDKINYYTTDPGINEARQKSDGYKGRLSPGLVYTENVYPRKLIGIQPYGVNSTVYIFREDQGEATVPLYKLYRSGYTQVLTSWESYRAKWIEKGYRDLGIVGYIYRP